jgi:hypothetical protein
MSPFLLCRRYDDISLHATMQTRFAIENHMTPMWQTALNNTKILRSQFGTKYDRSEARNNTGA